MWNAVFLLALLPFCASAGPSVAVFLDFEKQPSLLSIAEMKQEAGAILAPSGLALEWHLLNEPRGTGTFPDLVVIRFKGRCAFQGAPVYSELGPYGDGAALASTHMSGATVLPFSEVRCDELRRYIGVETARKKGEHQDAVFGRALGRVVAHELYHILASTVKHAPEGVARAYHKRAELVADKFSLGANDSALLREMKWRALLAGEAHPPDAGSPSVTVP